VLRTSAGTGFTSRAQVASWVVNRAATGRG
jgi:hypothetical protein